MHQAQTDSDPEDGSGRLASALDLMAHELRNAGSTLVSGLGLMPGSALDEALEIAEDMRPSAELLQVMTDLVVEAARADRRAAELEPAGLGSLLAQASRRARRGGLELEHDADAAAGEQVLMGVGTAERALCAAVLALGGRATAVLAGSELRLQRVAPGIVHERVAQGSALLAAMLCEAAGGEWSTTGSEAVIGFQLVP